MWAGSLRPDDGTYSALVRNFVHWGDTSRAVRVLRRMVRRSMVVRRRVVQPLIEALCASGRARAAVRVWQRTENLGVVYAAEDFATMLAACCRESELGPVEPLLRRLRDEAEERLPEPVLATLEAGLRAARTADGGQAFELARVQIGPDELRCAHCGTELEQLRLTDDQRRAVRERLVERAAAVDKSGALPQTLEGFERWLESAPPYDCVIDGPNVVRARRRPEPLLPPPAAQLRALTARHAAPSPPPGARRRTTTKTSWAVASTTTRWRTCASTCRRSACARWW